MDTKKSDFQYEVKVEIDEVSENKGKEITEPNTVKNSIEFNEKQVLNEYFEPKTIKKEEIKSEEDEDQFRINEFNENQIDDDYFDSNSIKPEEIEIKMENEEEDEFKNELLAIEGEKGLHPTNKADPLNNLLWINTNNHHADLEESPVFKCVKCSYQTNEERHIKQHVLGHRPKTFECLLCSYKTNNKTHWNRHKLVHIPKEEAKLHKCSKCPFTSKWKSALNKHSLVHKKPDEVTWHHCSQCPYKTKYKRNLISLHMLIHKKDQPTYKCTLCSYESPEECNLQAHQKNAHGLTQHSFILKKPDEITWYQCPECPYKTKHKNSLHNQHIWVHRNNRPKHECTLCPSKFTIKPGLKKHMERAHSLKDIPLISCLEEGCSYKTSDQSYLKSHISKVHKFQKMLKCSNCHFQTKHISSLKVHQLRHENPDKWLSCPLCPYKTPYRAVLNNHSLIHKSASEIKWFRCSECSFKTIHKRMLTQHNLKHSRGLQEVTDWFYCYVCSHRTSYKNNLAQHIRNKHRDAEGRICDHL